MDLQLIYKIIKRMVQLRIHIVDIGIMGKSKEKEQKYGMMVLSLKVAMKMIRNMEKENCS